ncbi:MAG: response regulator transcription factor [Micromonosporaceae bacterium]
MRILVVEDNDRVARGLVTALVGNGYDVRRVATGAAALAADPANTADVVLLDLGLPDMDGIEVCRRLREVEGVAVIAVTARGQEHDRVLGLRSGADDYVVKPFGVGELLARIEAVARRTRPARAARPGEPVHRIGPLAVDVGSRTATVDGRPLTLARKEFDLLAALAARVGSVCTRDHLVDQVWHATWEGPSRTLDVHVAALRAKLGDAVTIQTVRGVGYRLGG